jgi:hypothetical protein
MEKAMYAQHLIHVLRIMELRLQHAFLHAPCLAGLLVPPWQFFHQKMHSTMPFTTSGEAGAFA